MIVLDVNVLVYAYRSDARRHEAYRQWLDEACAGTQDLGLADMALVGFLRVVTNPRIFADPDETVEALAFVTALREQPRARNAIGSASAWIRFSEIVANDPAVRGKLVPDAWLAALTLAHGGRLATADRGFGRFPGLDFFDPLA